MTTPVPSHDEHRPPRSRNVQVVLEIAPKGSCFMEHIEGDISDVELHFPNGDCHCDVTVCRPDGDGHCVEVMHHSGTVCRNCPGIVFSEYELVPRFLERTTGKFLIKTYLPSDHQLSELVDDLRAVSHSVRVLRIIDIDRSPPGSQPVDVDLGLLTRKQRETLEAATERGYYDTPPGVALADLAETEGVSESALSQRLARAERTVMTQLFRS
jgi:hypothetical protein